MQRVSDQTHLELTAEQRAGHCPTPGTVSYNMHFTTPLEAEYRIVVFSTHKWISNTFKLVVIQPYHCC
jgi:hypothetical protein